MAATLGLYEVLKVDADFFFSTHISLCLYKRSFLKFCNCQCEKKTGGVSVGLSSDGSIKAFHSRGALKCF